MTYCRGHKNCVTLIVCCDLRNIVGYTRAAAATSMKCHCAMLMDFLVSFFHIFISRFHLWWWSLTFRIAKSLITHANTNNILFHQSRSILFTASFHYLFCSVFILCFQLNVMFEMEVVVIGSPRWRCTFEFLGYVYQVQQQQLSKVEITETSTDFSS